MWSIGRGGLGPWIFCWKYTPSQWSIGGLKPGIHPKGGKRGRKKQSQKRFNMTGDMKESSGIEKDEGMNGRMK
jgi:hypothetical protein